MVTNPFSDSQMISVTQISKLFTSAEGIEKVEELLLLA